MGEAGGGEGMAALTDLILRKCEAMPPVSRTRCSVLHGAPQSRDQGDNGPRISSAPLRAAQHPGHAGAQKTPSPEAKNPAKL
jgi:hypothetical protein